jgi:hypothetical protein
MSVPQLVVTALGKWISQRGVSRAFENMYVRKRTRPTNGSTTTTRRRHAGDLCAVWGFAIIPLAEHALRWREII